MSFRLLLVDDEADLRESVRYALVKEGFTVDEAVDGEKALVEAGNFLAARLAGKTVAEARTGILAELDSGRAFRVGHLYGGH